MEDRSFRRFGSICAIGTAIAWLVSAILLYRGLGEGGVSDVLTNRVHSPEVNYLLAAAGFLATAAIVALGDRLRPADGWARWATAIGVIGGCLAAAQCLWDALRYPQLKALWDTGSQMAQSVVAVLLSVPNPVDPRGIGAHFFVGIFVLVAGWLMLSQGTWPRWLGPLGMLEGVLLIVLFAAGIVGLDDARTILAAAAVGAVGPVWWLLAGAALWREPSQ
jgi:hypothetical protein